MLRNRVWFLLLAVPLLAWIPCDAQGQSAAPSPAAGDAGQAPSPPLAQPPFPAWMDQVSFDHPGVPASRQGPAGPTEPADPDPDGSLQPVRGPADQSRFRFTPPKMPDLEKFRKRASRMTLQRNASGSESSEFESFDCTNIAAEERKVVQLEAAIAALPAGPLREGLQSRLIEQKHRLAAAAELAQLLPTAASAGADLLTASPAAPLPPDKRRRVADLRRVLWRPPPVPSGPTALPTPPPASSSRGATRNTAQGTARIPERFYRPEGRRSFYQEMKESQAEGTESANTEGPADDPGSADDSGEPAD